MILRIIRCTKFHFVVWISKRLCNYEDTGAIFVSAGANWYKYVSNQWQIAIIMRLYMSKWSLILWFFDSFILMIKFHSYSALFSLCSHGVAVTVYLGIMCDHVILQNNKLIQEPSVWLCSSGKKLSLTQWWTGSMMTSSNGNIFRITGHLCGEFTGHRWIPRTKASDAELSCFIWSASE